MDFNGSLAYSGKLQERAEKGSRGGRRRWLRHRIPRRRSCTSWARRCTAWWSFRNKDLVILEKEFEAVSTQVVNVRRRGSWGEKGDRTRWRHCSSTQATSTMRCAIGPLVMMKLCAS